MMMTHFHFLQKYKWKKNEREWRAHFLNRNKTKNPALKYNYFWSAFSLGQFKVMYTCQYLGNTSHLEDSNHSLEHLTKIWGKGSTFIFTPKPICTDQVL
jgi:hypothetical protein